MAERALRHVDRLADPGAAGQAVGLGVVAPACQARRSHHVRVARLHRRRVAERGLRYGLGLRLEGLVREGRAIDRRSTGRAGRARLDLDRGGSRLLLYVRGVVQADAPRGAGAVVLAPLVGRRRPVVAKRRHVDLAVRELAQAKRVGKRTPAGVAALVADPVGHAPGRPAGGGDRLGEAHLVHVRGGRHRTPLDRVAARAGALLDALLGLGRAHHGRPVAPLVAKRLYGPGLHVRLVVRAVRDLLARRLAGGLDGPLPLGELVADGRHLGVARLGRERRVVERCGVDRLAPLGARRRIQDVLARRRIPQLEVERVSRAPANRVGGLPVLAPLVGRLAPAVPKLGQEHVVEEQLLGRGLVGEVVPAAVVAGADPMLAEADGGARRSRPVDVPQRVHVPFRGDRRGLDVRRVMRAHARLERRARRVRDPLAPGMPLRGNLHRELLRAKGPVGERGRVDLLARQHARLGLDHALLGEKSLLLDVGGVVLTDAPCRAELALGRVRPGERGLAPRVGRRVDVFDLDDLRLERLVVKGRGVGHGSFLRARRPRAHHGGIRDLGLLVVLVTRADAPCGAGQVIVAPLVGRLAPQVPEGLALLDRLVLRLERLVREERDMG